MVGWVLVDVHTKKHLGGVGDRRHADGDVPYLCAAPATGWRERVLSCRARIDGTWAPLQSFASLKTVRSFSVPGMDTVIAGCMAVES